MADSDQIVTGARPQLTKREKRWLPVYLLAALAAASYLVLANGWGSVAPMAVVSVFSALRAARPPTVVTAEGISRPWRRLSFLPWSLVDHVVHPTYQPCVQLVTTAGRTVTLDDIQAPKASRVADLGQRPLKPEALPVPRPIEREQTQREIEGDVARRAARLTAEWRRMSRETKP